MQEKTLEITSDEIEYYVEFGREINEQFSNFKAGIFSDKSSYEATFAKKCYYTDLLNYYIDLFISHHKVHAFFDGNKRTALFYLDINISLIHLETENTELFLDNLDDIAIAQVMYLEKEITEDDLKQIVIDNVRTVDNINI